MESLEKIIPFIFIVLWSIMAIANKNKGKKGANPLTPQKKTGPSKPSLINRLQQSLQEFAEAMETIPEKSGPEEAAIRSKKYHDATETATSSYKRHEAPDELFTVSTGARKKRAAPARTTMPAVTQKQKKLRDAVVWSEILAKPVSLRNEHHAL